MNVVVVELVVDHEGDLLGATYQTRLPVIPAAGDWVFFEFDVPCVNGVVIERAGLEVERRVLTADSSEVWVKANPYWASSLAGLSVFEMAEFLLHNGWKVDQKWIDLYSSISSPPTNDQA